MTNKKRQDLYSSSSIEKNLNVSPYPINKGTIERFIWETDQKTGIEFRIDSIQPERVHLSVKGFPSWMEEEHKDQMFEQVPGISEWFLLFNEQMKYYKQEENGEVFYDLDIEFEQGSNSVEEYAPFAPSGYVSFFETYAEVQDNITAIMRAELPDKWPSKLKTIVLEGSGVYEISSIAREITESFEWKYKDIVWGDSLNWLDTLADFVDHYLTDYTADLKAIQAKLDSNKNDLIKMVYAIAKHKWPQTIRPGLGLSVDIFIKKAKIDRIWFKPDEYDQPGPISEIEYRYKESTAWHSIHKANDQEILAILNALRVEDYKIIH